MGLVETRTTRIVSSFAVFVAVAIATGIVAGRARTRPSRTARALNSGEMGMLFGGACNGCDYGPQDNTTCFQLDVCTQCTETSDGSDPAACATTGWWPSMATLNTFQAASNNDGPMYFQVDCEYPDLHCNMPQPTVQNNSVCSAVQMNQCLMGAMGFKCRPCAKGMVAFGNGVTQGDFACQPCGT